MIPQQVKTIRVVYTNSTTLKHYSTDFETEAEPFSKLTWLVSYNKVGGATQLDMARFWSIEAAPFSGTAVATCVWECDGRALSTSTLTFTSQTWYDRIPFPPDGRGYIFQLKILSNQPIQIYKSNLDVVQTGIKGFVRHTYQGTPK